MPKGRRIWAEIAFRGIYAKHLFRYPVTQQLGLLLRADPTTRTADPRLCLMPVPIPAFSY